MAWIRTGNIKGPIGTAWTLTSADFEIPAIGETVLVDVGDTGWAAINEWVYVDDVGTEETVILQIVDKTPTSLTLLNSYGTTDVIEGPPGTDGTDGVDGKAATVTVRDTATLPPGSPATVTNVGDSTDAILDFGIPEGVPGVAGISTDADNLARNGSDGLIYVPGVTSRKLVVGDTVRDPNIPNGIFVPRYKNHPDEIWTPTNSFDDHFEGDTLDPKWTTVVGITSNSVIEQAGSCLAMMGQGAGDTVSRINTITQLLPNSNPFTLDLAFECFLCPYYNIGASTVSLAYIDICLEQAGAKTGVAQRIYANYTQGGGATHTYWGYTLYGVNYPTSMVWAPNTVVPKYIRFVYAADKGTSVYYSMNGKSWMFVSVVTGAQSGFATTPPGKLTLLAGVANAARFQALFDWAKFTNP